MSFAAGQSLYYSVGGSLEKTAPSYVLRQADKELYQAIKSGAFSYVLNSRQMGKSSLRVRTMQKLQAEGIACAVIDMNAIGSHGITVTEWYLGIMRRLCRGFGLRINVLSWWNEHKALTPTQKLEKFLENILASEISTHAVIFIDEIDSITHLAFKDDFFALIRFFCERRASSQDFQRLAVVMLGVALPFSLVENEQKSPFHLGRAIDLEMLQLSSATPLIGGLRKKADRPEELLRSIFDWTNGQPFLTQKLCHEVARASGFVEAGHEADFVEEIVLSKIIVDWEIQDRPEHLVTIRDRILLSKRQSVQMLHLYQRILQQGRIPATQSHIQQELLLSGLVRQHEGVLQVTCRIYRLVFNEKWIGKKLKETSNPELRKMSEAGSQVLGNRDQGSFFHRLSLSGLE